VRHPHFSQAVFVKFPRPNILRGAEGVEIFPPVEEQPLDEVMFREFQKLDSTVQRSSVKELVESSDREAAVEAYNRIRMQRPEDPVSAFANIVRKKAELAEPSVPRSFGAPRPISNDEDPFAD